MVPSQCEKRKGEFSIMKQTQETIRVSSSHFGQQLTYVNNYLNSGISSCTEKIKINRRDSFPQSHQQGWSCHVHIQVSTQFIENFLYEIICNVVQKTYIGEYYCFVGFDQHNINCVHVHVRVLNYPHPFPTNGFVFGLGWVCRSVSNRGPVFACNFRRAPECLIEWHERNSFCLISCFNLMNHNWWWCSYHWALNTINLSWKANHHFKSLTIKSLKQSVNRIHSSAP